MHEFDSLHLNYMTSSLPPSTAAVHDANVDPLQQASSKELLESGYDFSHNPYGYTHVAWSPWDIHPTQAHAMIPTSQMRSSAGHESMPALIQFPPPYLPEIPEITPVATELAYLSLHRNLFSSYKTGVDNLPMNWGLSSPYNYASPSLSSDTTSSPSPSLPSPPANKPLIIHQPRPCRKIPIVSLSQLASACEEAETKRPQPKSLSPLPFECLDFNDGSSRSGIDRPLAQRSFSLPYPSHQAPAGKIGDGSILCSCGCMERCG